MLFKNLLEVENEIGDNQLLDMEKQLKSKIQKAKSVASTCKVSKEADEVAFATTAAGELIFPDFKSDINYNEQFWKTYLKNQISFAMIKELSEKTNSLQQFVKQIQVKLAQLRFYNKNILKYTNQKIERKIEDWPLKQKKILHVRIKNVIKFTVRTYHLTSIQNQNIMAVIRLIVKNQQQLFKATQQQICTAQQKGEPLPQMRLHLPPGFLEEYRETMYNKKPNPDDQNYKEQQKYEQDNDHIDVDQSIQEKDHFDD